MRGANPDSGRSTSTKTVHASIVNSLPFKAIAIK